MSDMIDDGIVPCCNKCGWEPKNDLFLHFSLMKYINNAPQHNIHCRMCDFKGTITEWLCFYKNF